MRLVEAEGAPVAMKAEDKVRRLAVYRRRRLQEGAIPR